LQLFLQFRGPGTILLQSRGTRLVESLSNDDVNEIADAPAGVTKEAIRVDLKKIQAAENPNPKIHSSIHSSINTPKQTTDGEAAIKYATVGPNHSVSIQ
jgi:hypothetical protein